MLGAVAPVARRVARRLLEQAALVVMADGLDRHARVVGELADGDHVPKFPFGQLAAKDVHHVTGYRGGTRPVPTGSRPARSPRTRPGPGRRCCRPACRSAARAGTPPPG